MASHCEDNREQPQKKFCSIFYHKQLNFNLLFLFLIYHILSYFQIVQIRVEFIIYFLIFK